MEEGRFCAALLVGCCTSPELGGYSRERYLNISLSDDIHTLFHLGEKEQVSKYLWKPLAQSPCGGGPYITSTLTLNVSLHFNKAEETCPNINKLLGCLGKPDLETLVFA